MAIANALADHLPVTGTLTASASTVVLWGLHANEICAIVSTLCAVVGLFIQMFLVLTRQREMERRQEGADLVLKSLASSNRASSTKAAVAEAKADAALTILKPGE